MGKSNCPQAKENIRHVSIKIKNSDESKDANERTLFCENSKSYHSVFQDVNLL